MTILFNDIQFDAELARTLGHACYGGADLNECINTADRIKEEDVESWYKEWSQTAERALALARSSALAGHAVSAREAYLRASSYFRASAVFLCGLPEGPRLAHASDRQTDAFRRAAELFTPAAERVSIPFEGTSLPAYFFQPPEASTLREPRPTVIVTGGHDTSVEELYFWNAAAALRRGYNCICFDGPGQGTLLIRQSLPFRPDWENVVRPVVDYALSLPSVDPRRIAIMGVGFGGYLAPRAASGERRLAACVADPGQPDLLALLKSRLPPIVRDQLPNGNRAVLALVNGLLGRTLRHPTKGHWLRQRMWAHGASTPLDYAQAIAPFSVVDVAAQIRCPTLICAAENDPSAALAEELYTSLVCAKQLIVFTSAEGAGDPCESGARSLFHMRAFDWLDDVLRKGR